MKAKQDLSEAKCYQEITQLPFYLFVQTDITGNLSFLTISGNPSEEDLQAAWQRICSQYILAIGEQAHLHYLNLYIETAELTATLQQLEMVVPVIINACEHGIYYKEMFDGLNKLVHSSYKFSADNHQQNINYLKQIKNRSKGLKLKIDLNLLQLEEIKAKGENKKPTDKYYQSILVSLSNHVGYQITDRISTFEFCERVRRLNDYVKNLNSKNHGRQ